LTRRFPTATIPNVKRLPLLLIAPAFASLWLASPRAYAQDTDNSSVAANLAATANAARNGAGSVPPFAVPVIQIPFVPPLPAPPVPSGVGDILKGRFPLSIGYEDLGAGWRVFDYGGIYFSRGDTIFVSGTEYVVAYKLASSDIAKLSPRNYALFASRSSNSYGAGVRFYGAGVRFRLSLLAISIVQNQFTNGQTVLRSFSPDELKITAQLPTSEAFNQNLSLVYLRKIGEAFTAYSSANLNVLPPLDSAFVARQGLEEFAENPAIFTQPGTERPFAFNPLFSGRKRAHLKGKGYLILAYEAQPAPDGSHAVLTLGGKVSRLSEKQWNKLAQASQLG